MTEKELRNKVVEAAKAWYGRKESDGSHRVIVDTYNSHKPLARGYALQYTDDWCAGFVSAVAIKCGLTDIMPTEVSVPYMIQGYQNLGRWQENDAYVPQPGDVIMYSWDDNGVGDRTYGASHVGLVASCDGQTITVIEGNKGDAVSYRQIAVNGRYIRGFGLPNYASKATPEQKEKEGTEMRYEKLKDLPGWYKPTVEKLIKLGYLAGKGGEGDDTIIDMGEDMVRTLVINDRAGIYRKRITVKEQP